MARTHFRTIPISIVGKVLHSAYALCRTLNFWVHIVFLYQPLFFLFFIYRAIFFALKTSL
jgi:hypothetical protein